MLGFKDGARVRLWSRRGTDYTDWLTRIAEAVRSLPADALVDGEAVVFRPDGRSDFEALLARRGGEGASYVAFDLMSLESEDLRLRPLKERREALSRIVQEGRRRVRGDDRNSHVAQVAKPDLSDQSVAREAGWGLYNDRLDAIAGDPAKRFRKARASIERIGARNRGVVECLDDLVAGAVGERLDGEPLASELPRLGACILCSRAKPARTRRPVPGQAPAGVGRTSDLLCAAYCGDGRPSAITH
jgi:hypothetical protein